MEIITTGYPKSGNHALVKMMQLLGQECQIAHIPYAEKPDGKCIHIKRDPRNVICSWLRFTGKEINPDEFISAFKFFQTDSLVNELATFEGWLTDPSVLVVKYENLIASDVEARKIAAYLEIPYIDGAFEHLPGLTRTWFAEHSDYRQVWCDQIAAVWNAGGGNELLARWGY